MREKRGELDSPPNFSAINKARSLSLSLFLSGGFSRGSRDLWELSRLAFQSWLETAKSFICIADPARLAIGRVTRQRHNNQQQRVAAPEVQQKKFGGFCSDMYSFGMTICAIYNEGRPLIQANHSGSDYLKQLEMVSLCIRTWDKDSES